MTAIGELKNYIHKYAKFVFPVEDILDVGICYAWMEQKRIATSSKAREARVEWNIY